MHTAIVSKDPTISQSLRPSLHEVGSGTTVFASPSDFWPLAESFELLIYDTLLSNGTCSEFVSEARSKGIACAILAVTTGADVTERITVLRGGADDCVSRPPDAIEVACRAQALTRRHSRQDKSVIEFDDISLDRVGRSVTRAGKPVRLTEREFRTLEYFMRNMGRVIKPTELCEQVWKLHFDPRSNVVQVFIMRLRKKIEPTGSKDVIHTINKGGYVFGHAPEK